MDRRNLERQALRLALHVVCLAVTAFGVAQAATPVPTTQHCEAPFARVVAAQGEVRYRLPQGAWQAAVRDQALCAGDELQVGNGSRAALRLSDDSTVPLDQNTHLVIRGRGSDGRAIQIELLRGSIKVDSGATSPLQIVTPHGQVETAGGDFAVKVTPQQAALSVFEGKVGVSNPEGSLQLQGDETAFFAQLSAPKRDITVKSRDMVQWVVQYPAILATRTQPAWADAALAYEQGRPLDALISLDQVPPASRSAEYHLYRANLLLLAGRADEAHANIETALKIQPDLADAWALLTIVALGKSEAAQALQHAEKAIKLDPKSPAAHLAHSYAAQANRQAEAALSSARRMVDLAPDSALAHTRLAELELARGDRAAAKRAATRAEQLDPKLADAKAMLGFVCLSQDEVDAARAAFDSAIQLNSADPRSRMGLGLTRIRQGQLRAGREDLELAASLDPENPLLRTYLGRAYAEEGRTQDAAEQYARAKRSDPQDPTPYFFSALQMAETNQPVSAREQMQEALRRNENRAVYRGQALLTEDQALRKANEIGIDQEVGFNDSARTKASDAVVRSPASGVLHRALGDAMASLPRSGPTRQSEYLQALLREPIGVLPTPLSVDESVGNSENAAPQHSFFQASSPSQTGYNEFGAVFYSPRFRMEMDGLLAGQSTRGEQVRVAGGTSTIGLSLSQLNLKTNGFGQFNRLNNAIWQGALQAELDTGTRVYAERRQFDSRRYGVATRAEPFWFSALDIDEERSRNRFGLRQRIGENHEILLLDSRDSIKQRVNYLPTPTLILNGLLLEPQFNNQLDIRSHTSETQYVFHSGEMNLLIGTLSSKAVSRNATDSSITTTTVGTRGKYAYARYAFSPTLLGEVGGSLNRATRGASFKKRYASTKMGFRWEVVPGASLRVATFRVVNPYLPSVATLEPTQIAGFNQFVNDGAVVGIRTRNSGIGWDQNLNHGISYGFESLRRIIDVPYRRSTVAFYETDLRAHANWAIPRPLLGDVLPSWEKSLSINYDSQTYSRPGYSGDEQIRHYSPRHLRLGVNLAHNNGLSFNMALTRVTARGVFEPIIDEAGSATPISWPIDSRFWMLDAAVSYRLPGRLGQLILGAMNLTNRRGFQYFDMDPLNPRFAPERFIYSKFVVAF